MSSHSTDPQEDQQEPADLENGFNMGRLEVPIHVVVFGRRTAHIMSSSFFHMKLDHFLVSKVPFVWLRKLLVNMADVILGTKLSFLFLATCASIFAQSFGIRNDFVFTLSLLGIIPLAERVSFLTGQIAHHNLAVGGLLNALCGNVTEIIIAIFALSTNKIDVVKSSLLGSILSNLLFIPGISLLWGGIANIRVEQNYNMRQTDVKSLLQILALVRHSLSMMIRYTATSPALAAVPSLNLSRVVNILMLIAYVAYLIFQLSTHRQLFEAEDGNEGDQDSNPEEHAVIGLWSCLIWLPAMILLLVLLSKYVVGTIGDTSDSWGLSVSFLSKILIPIVANGPKLAVAIRFAYNNKLNISLGVALESATQVAMFVVPLCVTIAWIMGEKMDLDFNLLETGSLTVAVFVASSTLRDGTYHYMKGLILLLCYLVIGACFFH